MSCRIFRDFDTDEVVKVQGPNGLDSKLYKDALSLLKNEEDALNVWSAAYTPSFKGMYGDWENGTTTLKLQGVEPSLSDVMKFINLNTTDEKLSLNNSVDVLRLSQDTGLPIDTLYITLKRVFFNDKGQFVIDRNRLKNSKLYTDEEITNLQTYPSYRGEVKETISKLRNSLQEEVTVFDNISETSTVNHPLTIRTLETNSIGKEKTLPISEVEQYLKKNIGEFQTEEEFQDKLQSLDNEVIRDSILSNEEALNYTRDLLKDLKFVPVFSFRDGVITQKTDNDSYETLKNTLTVNIEKLDFTKTIDSLRSIPEDSWNVYAEVVLSRLKGVEEEAAKVGLDLDGLQNMFYTKTQDEIIGFLDLIDDFNIKTEDLTVSDADIAEFSKDINEFFNKVEKPVFESLIVPEEFKNKNLVVVETKLPETDLYRVEGLVKSFGNTYQRVDTFNNYNDAVESVYEVIQKDMTILPKEAFKTFGLKDGYYDVEGITNPINKDKVIQSINNFVSERVDQLSSETMDDYDTNRELTLMKAIYSPIEIKEAVEDDVAYRAQNFTGDIQYLTSDFITDFYSRMLEEKIINGKSELWENALKYFQINDKGIDIQPLSTELMEQVHMVLQSEPILYENLKNYSLVSKNPNLSIFREFDRPGINDINNRRDFVLNNPESVEKFQRDFERVGESSVITKNSNDEFIRLNDGVYELTSTDNGVSVYSKVDGETDPYYYIFGASSSTVEEINTDSFKQQSSAKVFEKVYSISQTNLKDSQDEISCSI